MTETQNENQPEISYIEQQRKSGKSDQDISTQLLRAGWSQQQIDNALSADVPPPPVPQSNNMTAQTSNSGAPLQIENVQYNMRMRPVESKVGLYIKIAGAGLWFTVVFICGFLVSIINRIGGSNDDLGSALVLTLSLSIVTTPIFVVAYKKFLAERAKNPASVDDIFLKKHVRKNLWVAVVAGAIAAIIAIYQFLSTLFLDNSSSSFTGACSALVFALGFGGIVYFYWGLHASTKR